MKRDVKDLTTEWLELRRKLVNGRYLHHKGGIYVVNNVLVDANTSEFMVVYAPEDSDSFSFARPLSEWDEEVGLGVKRFEKLRNIQLRLTQKEVEALDDTLLKRKNPYPGI